MRVSAPLDQILEEPCMELESDMVDSKLKSQMQMKAPKSKNFAHLVDEDMSVIRERAEYSEYTYEHGEENVSDEHYSEGPRHKNPVRYNFNTNECWISRKTGMKPLKG